jgi:biotin carboxyl carrier protein
MKYITVIEDREFEIEILDENRVVVNGVEYQVDFDSISDQPVYSLLVDGRSYEAYVYPSEDEWQVLLHGRLFTALVEDEREKRLRLASGGGIQERGDTQMKAPMPGLVVAVQVAEGQEVEKGAVLLILESMKMQNELRSPRDGFITRLRVAAGDSVEQHQPLLTISDAPEH